MEKTVKSNKNQGLTCCILQKTDPDFYFAYTSTSIIVAVTVPGGAGG